MSVEFLELFAGGGFPETDRMIETRGGQRLAVGAPGDRVNRIGVSVQSPHNRGLLGQSDTCGRDRHPECGQHARISVHDVVHGAFL